MKKKFHPKSKFNKQKNKISYNRDPVKYEIVDFLPTKQKILARLYKSKKKPILLSLTKAELTKISLKQGDVITVKILASTRHHIKVKIIQKLSSLPEKKVGLYHQSSHKHYVEVLSYNKKEIYPLSDDFYKFDLKDGDIIYFEIIWGKNYDYTLNILKRLCHQNDKDAINLISLYEQNININFSDKSLDNVQNIKIPSLKGRADLRSYKLITIDDKDAKDFDDAVWAEPDANTDNKDGWHIIVAIADVTHYVKTGDALDHDAYLRGNSIYLPNYVVPMLPPELSNGLCSLKPGEERACLAAHIWINHNGNIINHRFERGIMKSAARLTYQEVQHIYEHKNAPCPIDRKRIVFLYQAYACFLRAREKRNSLNLDLQEPLIIFDKEKKIQDITFRPHYDSHQLIEEFMVAANQVAAITLYKNHIPTLYRVHDKPDPIKIEELKKFIHSLTSIKFDNKNLDLNKLLKSIHNTPYHNIIHNLVLRSQAQAVYHDQNTGHFGLGLKYYCHFTSPIRRYADVIVHRALIQYIESNDNEIYDRSFNNLSLIASHISKTERQAAQIERNAIARYMAKFLENKIGQKFKSKISGINKSGIFVRINNIGAEGLIPISTLSDDIYDYSPSTYSLRGRRKKKKYQLGQDITTCLEKTNYLKGSIIFSIVDEKQKKKKN
ncbi:MAG: VacB/RNase II family 3'-5' exoribonuclease [Alphaproteobacteria bacterium]|nr:VacB/RNase II family 3'-5' exoribonuclease [Alphaproteobacteria bacterium]